MRVSRRQRRLLLALALAAVITIPVVAIASRGSGRYARTAPVGSAIQVAPSRGRIAPFRPNVAAGLDALARTLPLVRNPRLGHIDVDDVHGPLLEFDLAVPVLSGGRTAEALWQGEVFTGAAAAKLASGGTNLVEVKETLVTPDGTRRPIGGGLGHVVRNQLFASAPADITSRVAANAAGFGFHDTRTEVLHGLRDAIAMRARTDDVAKAATEIQSHPGLLTEIIGTSPTTFEGVFLEVDDTNGDPIYVRGIVGSNGSSMVWGRPGLDVSLPGASAAR
jgi:hypothetical protein